MQLKTVGPTGAKIMLLAEFPSPDDMRSGVPYSGWQGRLLDKLLVQAGISRFECLTTYVARTMPPGGNISVLFQDRGRHMPGEQLNTWLEELKRDIILYRPNIVVCLGSLALWAMTGDWKMKNYRGYIIESSRVPGQKIIPTESVFTVNKDYELTFPVIMDLRKAKRQSEFQEIPSDKKVLVEDASFQECMDYMDFLLHDPAVEYISADIETSRPSNHINRMGLAHSHDFGLSFKILSGRIPALPQREEIAYWKKLAEVLTCTKKKVFQNAPYDVSVLWKNNGILTQGLWMDTLIAAHSLWPESPRDLGFLASICLDVSPWKHTSSETPGYYNARDAADTLAIAHVLDQELDKFGTRSVFEREMRQIPVAIYMQLKGVRIDTGVQQKLLKECKEKAEDARDKLKTLLGKEINYNSPKQLAQLLYIDLGLPTQYKRGGRPGEPRKVTTDAEALRKLARENSHPVLDLILQFRKWNKLEGNIKKPVSPDSRYHTSYNIAWKQKDEGKKIAEEEGGTETGRWSSSASIIVPYGPGNLQNVNPFARKMYLPDEGRIILQADYVQAEAVVVAYLSGDHMLKEIFRTKQDLHCYTAAVMFGKKPEDIAKDSDERKVGKMLRHATNYSAGPAVVAKGLNCKISEAKKLLDMYRSANPLLLNWHKRVKAKLERDRILETPVGRRRKFLDRWDDSLFRSAFAFIPQSTVGDLLNDSMVELYERYGDVIDLWMQLHDAIYTQPEDNHDAVLYTMKKKAEVMVRPIPVEGDEMTIDIDYSVGRNWKDKYDAKVENDIVLVQVPDGKDERGKSKTKWIHYDEWSEMTKP